MKATYILPKFLCLVLFLTSQSIFAQGTISGMITNSGTIANEDGGVVQIANVTVTLNGDPNLTTVTDTLGTYLFTNIPAGEYTITAERTGDARNGVSTFDLVLIMKHILGVDLLDSPYEVLAADVNHDSNITSFDVVTLRQLILGIITEFPSSKSWLFIDGDHVFSNPNNPWQDAPAQQKTVIINGSEEVQADFVGIKIGDVNGNAIGN